MKRAAAVLVLLVASGCPSQTTTGQGNTNPDPGAGTGNTDTSAALTPEQMEEVQRTVRIGKDGITQCFEEEMERTKNKKLTGKVTVKIQIGVNKVAEQVVIGEATLKSPDLHACIIKTVKAWEFPKIPTVSWFTYPFEFSPAY